MASSGAPHQDAKASADLSDSSDLAGDPMPNLKDPHTKCLSCFVSPFLFKAFLKPLLVLCSMALSWKTTLARRLFFILVVFFEIQMQAYLFKLKQVKRTYNL